MKKREEYSVTEFANKYGVSRSAVLWRIKNKRLPSNYKVKKIGYMYLITKK